MRLREVLEASWDSETSYGGAMKQGNPAYGQCYSTARGVQYFFPETEIAEGEVWTVRESKRNSGMSWVTVGRCSTSTCPSPTLLPLGAASAPDLQPADGLRKRIGLRETMRITTAKHRRSRRSAAKSVLKLPPA